MKATPVGIGRQGLYRYCALRVTDAPAAPDLRASLSFDGCTVQLPVFCLDGAGNESQLWVVVLPALRRQRQRLSIIHGGKPILEREYGPRALDLLNSVTWRLRRRLSRSMWGIERRRREEGVFLELLGVYPYDDGRDVVRLRAVLPEGVSAPAPDPASVLVHGSAERALVLEDGVDDQRRHHTVMSYLVCRDCGDLVFSARGEALAAAGGPAAAQPGLLCLPEDGHLGLIAAFADFTRDAWGDERYPEFAAERRATPGELAAQRAGQPPDGPLVSLVLPTWRPDLDMLRACVDSVIAQTYARWELVAVTAETDPEALACLEEAAARDARIRVLRLPGNRGIVGNTNAGIEAARGTWVGFLDQDDLIEPDLLFEYLRHAREHPEVGALYCDEDGFADSPSAPRSPRLKPDFNRDALYAYNYLVHLLMLRADVLERVGLSGPELEGAQDYDLALKASEVAPIGHVPRVLYHWREHAGSVAGEAGVQVKPYAVEAGRQALLAHFARRDISAKVEPARSAYTYRVTFQARRRRRVSVVIPTKDHVELVDPCVTSLLERAGWDDLEVLLVENNSTDPSTFAYYDRLLEREPRVRLVRYDGTFNYSRIVNYGVREATGDALLLLNNDTVAASDACVATLAGYLERPEVGVVGPLLLFPDGLVQTAGLALMLDGRLGFLNQLLTPETTGGYLGSLELPRNCSAVLGAAQMVSRELFEELGGYDEELAVTYNDVDFCWRAREAGRLVTYTPFVRFYHREFATRGRDGVSDERAARTEREARRMREKWPGYFACGDPELNPGCDLASPWYKLPVPPDGDRGR